jgi:protein TonB
MVVIVASGISLVQPPRFAVDEGVSRIEIQYRPVESHSSLQELLPTEADLKMLLKKEEPVNSEGLSGAESESRPEYLKNPAPVYPKEALKKRQQGAVIISVRVSVKGAPLECEIKKSSGYALLDQAALSAVRQWVFKPAYLGALAIDSVVQVPVWFKLEQAIKK